MLKWFMNCLTGQKEDGSIEERRKCLSVDKRLAKLAAAMAQGDEAEFFKLVDSVEDSATKAELLNTPIFETGNPLLVSAFGCAQFGIAEYLIDIPEVDVRLGNIGRPNRLDTLYTPLNLAVDRALLSDVDASQLLSEASASQFAPPSKMRRHCLKLLEKLLASGKINPNQIDENGFAVTSVLLHHDSSTPQQFAAVLDILLSYGFDPARFFPKCIDKIRAKLPQGYNLTPRLFSSVLDSDAAAVQQQNEHLHVGTFSSSPRTAGDGSQLTRRRATRTLTSPS